MRKNKDTITSFPQGEHKSGEEECGGGKTDGEQEDESTETRTRDDDDDRKKISHLCGLFVCLCFAVRRRRFL